MLVIVAELVALETSGPASGMIKNWNMWFDAALMDKPGDIGGIAITSIGGQAPGPDAKSFLRPVDHRSLRCHLGRTDSRGGFNIDNHGVCQIDEIVGAVSEEGLPAMGACPARRGIGRRQIFGGNGRCSPKRCGIEHLQILPGSMVDDIRGQALFTGHTALAVRVGFDQAGVDGKALATDQSLIDATRDSHFEQFPHQVAIPEAAVAVL